MPIKDPLIMHSNNPLWKEQIQLRIHLRDINYSNWLENNLFTLVWWLMIILILALWFIWWRRVYKTRLLEIVTYGLMVMIIAAFINIVGSDYVLWVYPNEIFPLISPLTVVDYALLPVSYMLMYQYFPDWKHFIIAAAVLSVFLALIAQPIATLLDIYHLYNWKHFYDIPLYFLLGISIKGLLHKIKKKQEISRL